MMHQKKLLSCVAYPTTVILVDDDPSFLEKTEFALSKSFACSTYSDPEHALEIIKKRLKINDTLRNTIGIDFSSENYSHNSAQLPVNYDVSKLYEHLYQKNRFEEVSVVVVDYEMPHINGEEFCRRLRNIAHESIRIILLTGEADDPIAVKLFNSGMIDRFLRKAEFGIDEKLKTTITQMQQQYFQMLTYPILHALSLDEDSSLGDPAFYDLFCTLCTQLAATSYYLIELSGSFILFDSAGNATWLLIKTRDELRGIADEMEDAQLPTEVVTAVQKGEQIPYLGIYSTFFDSEQHDFEKFLHPSQQLQGKKTYCYAVVRGELPGFVFDRKKMLSFNDYRISR